MSSGWLDCIHDEDAWVARTHYAFPIVTGARDDDIIAFHNREPIRVARFLRDVVTLATYLPTRKYVLNLCTNRYHFAVAFAAALCRRQISLLPPNEATAVMKALTTDYPDHYCLTDKAYLAIPGMVDQKDLAGGVKTYEIPLVPARQPAVLLFSSGSTGRPKAVLKCWGTLVRSVAAAGSRLGIDGLRGATVIGTVPHQHSFGLESTVLLALQHNLIINSDRPFYPVDVRASIAASPRPRILVTTPVHIRALLAEASKLPTVDLIVSATAPLSRSLAVRAEASFGAALLEIYGCTEAGQVATRRTARKAEWQCLDGVVLRKGRRGSWVSGPSVQARTLLHDVIDCIDSETFVMRGRIADLVDVAGKHTSLTHLNQELLSIEGVKDGVFLMPEEHDDDRITRPIAFVVAPGMQAEAVLQALRERVDAVFLPRPLVLVDELPRDAVGKLSRDVLLQLAARSRCPS